MISLRVRVILISFIVVLLGKTLRTNATEQVWFGEQIEYVGGLWNEALTIELDEQQIFLYHDKQNERQIRLSVVSQGKSEVLWEADKIDAPWGSIPRDWIMASRFNAHAIPDLLVCYSDDCGTGQGVDCWVQNIHLFFDWQRTRSQPILLSSVDRRYVRPTSPDDHLYAVDIDGNPAKEHTSLVMILPAWEQEVCALYVWSQIIHFAHPPTNTPETVLYQVAEYRMHDNQMRLVNTIEGMYQQTSEMLHTVIQQRHDQPEAPAPLLLNFLAQKAPQSLYQEHEWFDWWK